MFSVVYITSKDMIEARKIAMSLVEDRLVACTNMFPMTSVYKWEGSVQEDSEVAIICKTRTEKVPEVIARVKEMHSYEIPCITSWSIGAAHLEYLDWVKKETE